MPDQALERSGPGNPSGPDATSKDAPGSQTSPRDLADTEILGCLGSLGNVPTVHPSTSWKAGAPRAKPVSNRTIYTTQTPPASLLAHLCPTSTELLTPGVHRVELPQAGKEAKAISFCKQTRTLLSESPSAAGLTFPAESPATQRRSSPAPPKPPPPRSLTDLFQGN